MYFLSSIWGPLRIAVVSVLVIFVCRQAVAVDDGRKVLQWEDLQQKSLPEAFNYILNNNFTNTIDFEVELVENDDEQAEQPQSPPSAPNRSVIEKLQQLTRLSAVAGEAQSAMFVYGGVVRPLLLAVAEGAVLNRKTTDFNATAEHDLDEADFVNFIEHTTVDAAARTTTTLATTTLKKRINNSTTAGSKMAVRPRVIRSVSATGQRSAAVDAILTLEHNFAAVQQTLKVSAAIEKLQHIYAVQLAFGRPRSISWTNAEAELTVAVHEAADRFRDAIHLFSTTLPEAMSPMVVAVWEQFRDYLFRNLLVRLHDLATQLTEIGLDDDEIDGGSGASMDAKDEKSTSAAYPTVATTSQPLRVNEKYFL